MSRKRFIVLPEMCEGVAKARGKARLGDKGNSKDSMLESERAGELKAVASSEADRLRLRTIFSIFGGFGGVTFCAMGYAELAADMECL